MIAGAIAAPRFRMDNEALVRAHVHALVLETMGLKYAQKLPSRASELMDLAQENLPLYADWRVAHVWHKMPDRRVYEYDFGPYFIEPYAVGQTTFQRPTI